MKRFIWVILLVAVVLFGFGACTSYNKMVSGEEAVSASWADVQTQYQRRADLIPNLVNTVKGYAEHESETFAAVTAARSRATSINLTAADLTPENLEEFQVSQQQVSGALGRLLAVAEAYPELKANQNFLELQSQLEGTENRIAVARKNFNETTQNFNKLTRRFPANVVAKMFQPP